MESKNEKLAQARKKLLNYQKKLQKSRTENSSPVPSVSIADSNFPRPASSIQTASSFNHDEKRSPFEWLPQVAQGQNYIEAGYDRSVSAEPSNGCNSVEQSEVSIMPCTISLENVGEMNHHDNEVASNGNMITVEEFNRLNTALSDVVQDKEKLSAQLAALHKHYAEIYAAYSALVATTQIAGSGDSEVQTQLAQLRTAMSVVVEEKTALQQQLREASELAKKRLEDLQSLKEMINEKTSFNAAIAKELNDAKKENESLNELVRKQKEELDRSRKESIGLQASVLHVQQDRNHAQERLKLSLKSAEQLQTELDETKKQLRLKEMYIRQLGAYSATASINEQDIRNLHSENERLNAELSKAQMEVDQFRKEAQAAREHYETYGAQLNQQVLSLSNKLEETAREKMFLLDKLHPLEEEIQMLRSQVRADCCADSSKDNALLSSDGYCVNTTQDKFEELKCAKSELIVAKEKIVEAENNFSAISQRCSQLEQELAMKVCEVEEVQKKLVRTQSLLNEQERTAQDYCHLSTQLQSEKSTLSRAIAQNRELKEQLVELQDKMIALSTENMESESERLTAVHTIEQLNAEIVKLKNLCLETKNSPERENVVLERTSETERNSENIFETENSFSAVESVIQQEYCSNLEKKIAQSNTELEQLRLENRRLTQQIAELRRIMEQNAEDENQNNIHVEFGQAVERINSLSAENERLLTSNQELQETVNTLRAECSASQNSTFPSAGLANPDAESKQTELRKTWPPTLLEKPIAWTELEARFAKLMRQNAELMEQNGLLEHLILQLQSENDTIGEYVTIYHHQRKLIQERIRARDEAVAKLSLEKEHMKQKLKDLETAVSTLFFSNESLHKRPQNFKDIDVQKVSSDRKKQIRSFSHSTVDEFSGDEETVVDGSNQIVPVSETARNSNLVLESDVISETVTSSFPTLLEGNGEVLEEKILRLINELQDMEQARMHPPCAVNICCRECRGNLITL